MKNKKLLAALLIASISLTACVKNGEDEKTETNTASSQEQASQGESLVDKEHSIKDEPRYGSKIRIGFDGDLCIAGQNIAEIEGYYKEKDLDVEFVNIKQGKDVLELAKLML